MYKKSKILKNILSLTKNDIIYWKSYNQGYKNTKQYSTVYKITKLKSIKIEIYTNDILSNSTNNYVTFTYIDNKNKISNEITEIYPFNELSTLSYYYLNNILNRIVKKIKKLQIH